MRGVGGAVGRTLRLLGLDRGVAQADAIRAWPRAVGASLGQPGAGIVAARVDGETIVVLVPSSTHAAEVRLKEREILAALESFAPGSGIRHIRCAPAAPGRR